MCVCGQRTLLLCDSKAVRRSGFTLIELLVVVTIILVMTVVASISFAGGNQKARDNRRMADVEKIRTALELYRQSVGYYPLSETSLEPDYLDDWPTDPKDGSYYYVRGVGTSYTYSAYAKMEGVGSTTGTYGDDCGGTCNYLRTNP